MRSKLGARVTLAVVGGLLLLGIAGGLLFANSTTIAGIRDREVNDATIGRLFLIQEIAGALPDLKEDISGTFEFYRVPGEEVLKFAASMSVVENNWIENTPESAIVITWTSSAAKFQAPRARPGYDATAPGDTFVLILVPDMGWKITTIVFADRVASLRASGAELTRESLTLIGDAKR